MSKHLLENTKRYFVNWFNAQPPDDPHFAAPPAIQEMEGK